MDIRDFFGPMTAQVLPVLERKGYRVSAETIPGSLGAHVYVKVEGGSKDGAEVPPVSIALRRDEAQRLAHALLYLAGL